MLIYVLGSDFVSWIVQALYLVDRKAAIRMGQKLQERGVICCMQPSFIEKNSPNGSSSSFSNLPLTSSTGSLPVPSQSSSAPSTPVGTISSGSNPFLKIFNSYEQMGEVFDDNNAWWKFVKVKERKLSWTKEIEFSFCLLFILINCRNLLTRSLWKRYF